MSQRRTVEYVFTGSTRGFEAAQNRILSGLGRLQTQSRRTSGELGMIDQQMRAIGTTARYAFAGAFIFGITGAIQRLTDFQNQLGTVASLAGTINNQGNYQAPSNNFLGSVGDQAMLAANRVGVATDDVQNYMSRFFSTFQYTNRDHQRALADMRAFTGEVTRLQATMGIEAGDPQQLAGGIAGFVNQIPGGRRNIPKTTNRVANMILELTAATPNITGRDISRDIGRIGATMSQTGMTPEQTFSVWAQAGRAGGSASVIGRGIAQMMGNLLHPNTPTQQQAYLGVGLPTDPNSLRQMGAMNVLQRMIRATVTGPIAAQNANALNNENIDDPTQAIAAANVRGIDLNRVYGLFGRQESARQFVNLLAQGGVKGLQDFIRTLKQAEDQNRAGQRERAALNQRELARFGVARQNISLGLARGAAYPLEHIVAPPIIAASDALAGHPHIRQAADAALGAVLLRSGIRRFLRGRAGAAGGASAAGLAIAAEEAPALLAGGAHPTGSRDNPIWVMISPASWFVGSPGGFASPAGTGEGTSVGMGRRLFNRLRPALPLATAGGAEIAIPTAMAGASVAEAYWLTRHQPVPHAARGSNRWDTDQQRAIAMADSFANKMTGFNADRALRVEGQANADLTVRLVDAQGRQITVQEHKGVPVKIWGANQMPTSQGKRGTKKGH
jgi:hypothetical protein